MLIYIRYSCLCHQQGDLEFFETCPGGEPGLRDRLRNVLQNDFVRMTYTELVELVRRDAKDGKVSSCCDANLSMLFCFVFAFFAVFVWLFFCEKIPNMARSAAALASLYDSDANIFLLFFLLFFSCLTVVHVHVCIFLVVVFCFVLDVHTTIT